MGKNVKKSCDEFHLLTRILTCMQHNTTNLHCCQLNEKTALLSMFKVLLILPRPVLSNYHISEAKGKTCRKCMSLISFLSSYVLDQRKII